MYCFHVCQLIISHAFLLIILLIILLFGIVPVLTLLYGLLLRAFYINTQILKYASLRLL